MDRLLAIAHQFVGTVLGDMFLHEAEQELNLAAVVDNEVGNCVYLLLYLIISGCGLCAGEVQHSGTAMFSDGLRCQWACRRYGSSEWQTVYFNCYR